MVYGDPPDAWGIARYKAIMYPSPYTTGTTWTTPATTVTTVAVSPAKGIVKFMQEKLSTLYDMDESDDVEFYKNELKELRERINRTLIEAEEIANNAIEYPSVGTYGVSGTTTGYPGVTLTGPGGIIGTAGGVTWTGGGSYTTSAMSGDILMYEEEK